MLWIRYIQWLPALERGNIMSVLNRERGVFNARAIYKVHKLEFRTDESIYLVYGGVLQGYPYGVVYYAYQLTVVVIVIVYMFRGVAELITSNADYLVNSVSLVLQSHTHTHDQEPLQVLKAILRHGFVVKILLYL